MKQDESISLLVFLVLGVVLLLGVYEGLWPLHSVLEYVPYFVMAGMVGFLVWGFRERIENALKRQARLELTTSHADCENVREIQVRCLDGTLKYPARFYFVTLRNLSGPTISE